MAAFEFNPDSESPAIAFEYLLQCKDWLLDKDSDLYKITKKISDTHIGKKYECENDVYKMLNTYVVEQFIKGYLNDVYHTDVTFYQGDGSISHNYYVPRTANVKPDMLPDLIDRDGVTIEIKSGKHTVEKYDWDRNDPHGANIVLFYDRFKEKLFEMYYDSRTHSEGIDLWIELPFPDC